jgi:hypothetical protein
MFDGTWENTVHDDDEETPVTFATRDDAEQDLSDHLAAMQYAQMGFDPTDYRIVAAYPPVDKNRGGIYADTMNALQAADELGGCNDAGEYIALMQAVIAECQTRILCAKDNYYAQTGTDAHTLPTLPGDTSPEERVDILRNALLSIAKLCSDTVIADEALEAIRAADAVAP